VINKTSTNALETFNYIYAESKEVLKRDEKEGKRISFGLIVWQMKE
jgi:hypothetical protein